MDPLLLGYADAWAGREERPGKATSGRKVDNGEELRARYSKGYNEALEHIKRANMFNRTRVNSLQQKTEAGGRLGESVVAKKAEAKKSA